jgi:hypothetical protein
MPAEPPDAEEAFLEGGPASLPPNLRRVLIAPFTDVVKVPFLGGYEHFVRAEPGVPDGTAAVFRWSGRTQVAE